MSKKTLTLIFGSLAVLLATLGVGGGLAWFKYDQIRKAQAAGPPPMMPEMVSTAKVETIRFRQAATAVGTVMAPRWITLRNEVSGAIEELFVQSGQEVEIGQKLLVLDQSVEAASLDAAKARLDIAQSIYRRNYKMSSSEAVSEMELEQSEAEMRQAKAEVSRLEAIIAKKTIRAPFSAQLGILNVYEGQYLPEGSEIAPLQGRDDFVFVDFMLPQTVADEVTESEEVKIEYKLETLVGKIVAFDSRADRSTRNLLVRAELKNPPKGLSPNDSVRVEVPYGPEIEAQSIPMESLRRTPTGAHVFVVEQDQEGRMVAAIRPVLPGRIVGNRLTVMTGLSDADRVISEGSFKLRDGVLIAEKENSSAEKSSKPESDSTSIHHRAGPDENSQGNAEDVSVKAEGAKS